MTTARGYLFSSHAHTHAHRTPHTQIWFMFIIQFACVEVLCLRSLL